MKKHFVIVTLGLCMVLSGCAGSTSASLDDSATAEEAASSISAETVAKAIDDIQADEDGNVTIYLADGRYFDLGNLKGEDGKDGKDGVGIAGATVNDDGELVLSLTDGSTINNGTVKGSDGKNGSDGADGTNGVGIQSSVVNENGELVITLTDGTTINNGVVQGKDGKDGKDGRDGVNGKDGTNGKDGADGKNGTNGKNGDDGAGATSLANVEVGTKYPINATLPLVVELNSGSIVHLEDWTVTLVEKHSTEELSDATRRQEILDSCSKKGNYYPLYVVEVHMKGYVENKQDDKKCLRICQNLSCSSGISWTYTSEINDDGSFEITYRQPDWTSYGTVTLGEISLLNKN